MRYYGRIAPISEHDYDCGAYSGVYTYVIDGKTFYFRSLQDWKQWAELFHKLLTEARDRS